MRPNQVIPTSRPQHIIEWRMPLPYVIGGIISIASFTATVWFKVDRLVEEVRELKIEVQVGNSKFNTANGTLVLMQFRMENAESDIRMLKGKK